MLAGFDRHNIESLKYVLTYRIYTNISLSLHGQQPGVPSLGHDGIGRNLRCHLGRMGSHSERGTLFTDDIQYVARPATGSSATGRNCATIGQETERIRKGGQEVYQGLREVTELTVNWNG